MYRLALTAGWCVFSLLACETITPALESSNDSSAARSDAHSGQTDLVPGSASDSDGPMSDASTPSVASSCEGYCSKIMKTCPVVSPTQQYPDQETCVEACRDWTAWARGADNVTDYNQRRNTVGCRLHHLDQVSQDAPLHCDSAGLTGGNHCGTWCENYCALALRNCSGLFEDAPSCLQTCLEIPVDGDPKALTGDHIQCRIQWLARAGATTGALSEAKAMSCTQGSPESTPDTCQSP